MEELPSDLLDLICNFMTIQEMECLYYAKKDEQLFQFIQRDKKRYLHSALNHFGFIHEFFTLSRLHHCIIPKNLPREWFFRIQGPLFILINNKTKIQSIAPGGEMMITKDNSFIVANVNSHLNLIPQGGYIQSSLFNVDDCLGEFNEDTFTFTYYY